MLPALEIVTLPLVDSAGHGDVISEETKVSSTNSRKKALAILRGGEQYWCRSSDDGRPYVIGLTGGIASGESTAGGAHHSLRMASCM